MLLFISGFIFATTEEHTSDELQCYNCTLKIL